MEILDRIEDLIINFNTKGKMVAFAESCTGGFMCHMFTNISGSSNVFERGVVCYSNQAKIELLGVNKQDIETHGAVSEQVAKQLAQGIKEISHVDVGIGITGIAGPTGGTPEKPVGLVYIGFSSEEGTRVQEHQFNANRITFKELVLEEVLSLLENYLSR